MTLRDQVWNEALDTLDEHGEFKLSDLGFNDSERHTVRRVLRRMEDYNWLRRDTPNSSIWRRGTKYESVLGDPGSASDSFPN